MFSCALLCCGDKGETNVLVADKATVDVRVVSSAGQGSVTCVYQVENSGGELVLHVPSVINLKGGSTLEVKLTGCHLNVVNEGRTSLKLLKLDGDYPVQTKNLPSYETVKKGLFSNVSPSDVILHLGHFEPKTELTIHIEFLLKLFFLPDLSNMSGPCHILESGILAKQISYKLKFASQVQIMDVSPSSHSLFVDFSWHYTDRSKQVVHASYETVCDMQEEDEAPSIYIKMANQNHAQSECCTCLKKSCKTSSRKQSDYGDMMTNYEEDDNTRRGDENATEGMMMISIRNTPDQLPRMSEICMNGEERIGSALASLSPSEFVFLVDCSASMNLFIDNVVSTLITCIKSLPEGCFFNMIAFGSSFRQLFHESKEYSKSYVKYAVEFANQLKANLGGTELLPPLKWIFKKARKSDMPCQVFVITDVDQEIKDVPYMLKTISKNRHHTRFVKHNLYLNN